jgi:DNA polymerase-3 subunit gamma/tau
MASVSPSATPAESRASLTPQTGSQSTGSIDDWLHLATKLELKAINLQLAMNCAMLSQNDDALTLSLLPVHKQLLNESRRQIIEQAVQQHTGSKIRVNIEVSEHTGLTPAALEKQQQDARQQSAVNAIESDSNVQSLIDTFGASISPGSIQPVD